MNECKNLLKAVIEQAIHNEETSRVIAEITGHEYAVIKIPTDIPKGFEECERRLIEVIKLATDIRKHPDGWSYNKPYYNAGWLGIFEGAFYYLVERGIAKFVYPDWDQMIFFPDEYPEGGEIADS